MESEKEIANLIQHLQITYNTLNHYAKTNKGSVEWVNLEYSKKFIYERLETAVGQLNRIRAINSDKNLLHSSIRGAMAATGQIPRGHIQGLPN